MLTHAPYLCHGHFLRGTSGDGGSGGGGLDRVHLARHYT